MLARIYHERGSSKYHVVLVDSQGRCTHKLVDSREAALKYIENHKSKVVIETREV